MATPRSACPGCLEFEEEIRVLRQRLAAVGHYVTYSPGPNSNPNVEDELRRWLRARVRTRMRHPDIVLAGPDWPASWDRDSVIGSAAGRERGVITRGSRFISAFW
jgi:hypothetical protein